jgi:hypothetical protein
MKVTKTHIACFIAALLLAIAPYTTAQNATATLDKKAIQIGEQTTITITIQYRVDKGKHVQLNWNNISDTLCKQIEVLSTTITDTSLVDSLNPYLFQQSKTLLITSFDSGTWVIPPFGFSTNLDSTKVFSNELQLTVNTIAVDTTQDIKDIKTILSENYSLLDWIKDNKLYALLGLVLCVAFGFLIYWALNHFKKKPEPIVIAPVAVPAHVLALEKLDKLKAEKLWQEGKDKTYYSKLTNIMREYIENRFNIRALEQTTDEIMYGFRNIALDNASKEKLQQVLSLSDLVKFAKENPLPAENETNLANVYDFVNGTKREDNETPLTKKK